VKKALALAWSFFLLAEVSASDWKFEFSPKFSLANGMQDEFVFAGGKKLSELNWQIKNVPVFAADAKISYRKIFVSAGGKIGIPKKSGKLFDGDWQNALNSSESISSIKTNYSEGENSLKNYRSFFINAGGEFSFGRISILPFAGMDFSAWKFKSSDGKGRYSTNENGIFFSAEAKEFYEQNGYYGSYSLCKTELPLCAIQLEREILFTWIGSGFRVSPAERLEVNFSFAVSPFAYARSLDTHYTDRSETYAKFFLDEMWSKWCAVKENLCISFAFSKNHTIYLSAENVFSSTLRGTTKISYGKSSSGGYYRSLGESGASVSVTEFSFGYRLKF
jgi:outer membrane protease